MANPIERFCTRLLSVLWLQAAYQQIDFNQIEAEIQETQAVCALTNSPVVFGHNDLLSGNILILQQPGFDPKQPDLDGPLCFIDYEYGSYTYRGFDIGNHFTEYAGFEGDYTRWARVPPKSKSACSMDPSAV